MTHKNKNPCPVCYQKFGSLMYNHKASYCMFKETKIACNLCAGEHKISECPHQQKITRRKCDRCKRNNHATEQCFAKPCKRCGSLCCHNPLFCTQKNSEQHSKKKPRLQEGATAHNVSQQNGQHDWRKQNVSQHGRREQNVLQHDWREQTISHDWGEQSGPHPNISQQKGQYGWREQNEHLAQTSRANISRKKNDRI